MSLKVHFKGLNGIRAIAAFAVVIAHIGLAGKNFGFLRATSIDLAGFGVSIFFSLSGFLITYLLLLEKAKFSKIDIKKFYIRRILRIWPLYFFYLFLSLATIYVYEPDKLPGSTIFYIFLSANIPFITGTTLPHLTHYWSLAVEEQFYLFWPWFIKNGNNLLRNSIIFTAVMVVFKIIFRIWDVKTGNSIPYVILHTLRFHCMSIGAIGAILYYKKVDLFIRLTTSFFFQLIAWGSLILMAFNKFHLASVIDNEIAAIFAVVLIINVSVNKRSIVKLDYPVFDFLGRISFGIYVYHPLIIFFFGRFFGETIGSLTEGYRYSIVYSIIPALTIIVAFASYEVFEKRFIHEKEKYSNIVSTA